MITIPINHYSEGHKNPNIGFWIIESSYELVTELKYDILNNSKNGILSENLFLHAHILNWGHSWFISKKNWEFKTLVFEKA